MTTPAQLRAARAILGATYAQVSEATGLSVGAVRMMEDDHDEPAPGDLAALRAGLEACGVMFLAADPGGPGVRLVTPRP